MDNATSEEEFKAAVKDYQEVIRKLLPPEITMLKMTRRPFGFKFRVKGFDQALYEVKLTTRTYGWSRIK